MRSLAVLCFALAAGSGCSYPVGVQPLPASDMPLSRAPSTASVGLLVDAARVPDAVAVEDSFDSPTCGLMRYPLAAKAAFAQSVIETVRSTATDVRLLDRPAHPWSLRDDGLDAALTVQVDTFEVNLRPARTLTAVSYTAESRIGLTVVAITPERGEIRESVLGVATQTAVDRWGLTACGRGALPATRATERAIRSAMSELSEWATETLRWVAGHEEGAMP